MIGLKVSGLVLLFVVFGAGVLNAKSKADTNKSGEIDIPYRKFILDNGLTLIVHEDHKAPIVAVNVWYHVGSKNEKPGKTGFAHLFEHLMFNGSENFNDDYFQAMERVGATDLNGTTNRDRTNYFQNVPTSALDVVLWMESDRMGHLLGAIDQARLDEQRGVVQNEKRQGENQPYGRVFGLITENSFPNGHPYSWTTIGSMEDLDAASLDDVHEWFKSYYGAANAILVIAGDVEAEAIKKKVEKYFGDIPSGPPVTRYDSWTAGRSETRLVVTQDRVPQARLYRSWNVPQWGSADHDYLEMVAAVLASGKTSRLYKRLVYDDQIATDVSAFIWSGEIASNFVIQATARPGEDLAEIEKAVEEELQRFLKGGPTEKELKRVQTQFQANFVRGIERIGGFGGKSDILAMNEVYGGGPDFYKTTLTRTQKATATNLLTSAQAWLAKGDLILEVHPFPEFNTVETDVDRSKLPEPAKPPKAKFPELQRATLSNGLKIVLAERHTVPLVNFNLQLDAGYASDQFGTPGTASLAMNMLDEGTKTRNALQISDELQMLGARLSSGSNLDMSFISLSALKTNLKKSLELFADVILHPSFPEADFERLQKQQLARILREKATPVQMALRVFPKLIYGENHAYSLPFTGSGFESTVTQLTRADLRNFHQTWFKPNNATLVIVGATTLAEITPKLEKLFGDWQPGDVPEKNISTVGQVLEPVVYLLDRPGSQQSIIFTGHVALPKANPDEVAIETFIDILGGTFTSRINMNLREDKHWSYGAFCFMVGARGQRPLIVYAPVQTDKTKESMQEVLHELEGIVGEHPPTEEELIKNKKNRTLSLPGSWETIAAVGNSVNEIVRYDLGDDYFETLADKIQSLSLAEVASSGKKLVHPKNLIWVVVGDREKIEAGVRELGFGEIRFIDSDGNQIE